MKSTTNKKSGWTVVSATAVLATLLASVLAGCGSPPDPGSAHRAGLAIVQASTANSARLPAQVWVDAIGGSVTEGTRLAVVSDGGEPRLIGSGVLENLSNNSATRAEQINAFVSGAVAAVASAKADVAETNPLGAIALAARAVRDPSGVGGCTILVAGSMLSTAGPLLLQETTLQVEPSDVASALADAKALPDLSGCVVRLLSISQVAGTQPQLPEELAQRLDVLIRAILEKAGAKVEIAPLAVSQKPAGPLPRVTPVPVATSAIDLPVAVRDPAGCQVRVPDQEIGFLPDSAQFRSPKIAQLAVTRFLDALRKCAGTAVHVSVVGTTSSAGTRAGRLRLSRARADAVAALVAHRLGVPVAAVEARGIGNCEVANPHVACVNDRASGALDVELAVQNRNVVLVAS